VSNSQFIPVEEAAPEIALAVKMVAAIAKQIGFDAFVFSAVKLSADAPPDVHTTFGMESSVPPSLRKGVLGAALRTAQEMLEQSPDLNGPNTDARA
jgi:hypothetical protein